MIQFGSALGTARNGARSAEGTGLRAIGYPRVSTDEQRKRGYSLPAQRKRIEEYCERGGFKLVDVIEDDFTSRTLNRPGLSRITKLAEAGAFDVLVCMRLDRMARQNYLRRGYEEWLEKQGVEVVFVEQHFDATPSGRLQKGLQGEIDEYEWEKLRIMTMNGRRDKAEEKSVMPCRCDRYGYHQVSVAEAKADPAFAGHQSGALIEKPGEAEVVHRIFTLYAAGASLRQIAGKLHAEGVLPKRCSEWRPGRISRILADEAYVGRLYYGKTESRMTDEMTPLGNVRKEKKLRDRSEWVELSCPALISEELFQACQRRLVENQERLRGRPTRLWLLHGCIVCGVCKTSRDTERCGFGAAKRWAGDWYRYYLCSSRNASVYCGAVYRADHLETMALDALRRAAEPHRLAEFARQEAEERNRNAGNPADEVKRLKRDLANVDTQEKSLLGNALSAGFTQRVIQGTLADLKARRHELHRQLAMSQGRLAECQDPEDAARKGEVAAERLRAALPEAEKDLPTLQELFRLFLEVRIFPKGEPEITVRVPSGAK